MTRHCSTRIFSLRPLERHTAHAPHRPNRLIQALGTGSMLLSQPCYPSTLLFRIRIPFLCQVGYPHEEIGFALAGVLHACYSYFVMLFSLKSWPVFRPRGNWSAHLLVPFKHGSRVNFPWVMLGFNSQATEYLLSHIWDSHQTKRWRKAMAKAMGRECDWVVKRVHGGVKERGEKMN